MKNQITKIISVLLVFVISALVLSSCNLPFWGGDNSGTSGDNSGNENDIDIPDDALDIEYGPTDESNWFHYPAGYTAGFPNTKIEHWWVETYEECLAAIELLKSHGSTFEECAIFTHEGDLFDVKYCFEIISGNQNTEKIKFGDNPFDRRAMKVRVVSYAFFDELTIDEINHSIIYDYSVYSFRAVGKYFDISSTECTEFRWMYLIANNTNICNIYFADEETSFRITNLKKPGQVEGDIMSDECVECIINSIQWIR